MRLVFILLVIGVMACTPQKENSLSEEAEKEMLIQLLNRFLHGASINDYDTHVTFWADDLIYTGSAGTRTNKQNILDGIRNATPNPDDSEVVYHAEDIQIQLYGTTAIVAFKLVATFSDDTVSRFYNTGTFLKRNNHWQAVAWQATRIL